MWIQGGIDQHFLAPHFEAVCGGVLIDFDSGPGFGIWGFRVVDGHWLGNAGINGGGNPLTRIPGAGYEVSITSASTPDAPDLTFTGNAIYAPMDNSVMANGCLGVVIENNTTSFINF